MCYNIPSASQIRSEENDIHKIGLEKAINSVVDAIKKANESGRAKTCFNPPAYWYTTREGIRTFISFYDEVKEIFKRKGYTFKPTGCVGGVWQRTEDICWFEQEGGF